MGLVARCHYVSVGAPSINVGAPSNGAARHATTHKRPRCPYSGSRAGHGVERTGRQNAEFQFSPPGCARSQPARSQRAEYPRAFVGTFAIAGHQRTDLAAKLDAATRDASRAPFRFPIDANRGPFRFPIPDGPLALAFGIRPANNATCVTLLDPLRDHLGLNGTKITGFQFRVSGAATIWSERAPKRKVGGVRIAAIAAGVPCLQPYATAFSASK
jgi:hypothetical protein